MRKLIAFLLVLLLAFSSYLYLDSYAKQFATAPLDATANVTRAENPRTMFMHNNTTGSPQLITNDTLGTQDKTYYESIRSGANKTWTSVPAMDEERFIDNIYARLYLEPRLELEGFFGATPDLRGIQHGILNFSGDAGSVKINGTSSSEAGFSVAIVDLNHDGYDDVVIGAPYNSSADGSISECGAVYIFLGREFFDLYNDTPRATVTIYGAGDSQSAGQHFGWSVANGSDLNGDGIYDLIVGAPDNASSRGAVYVFYGNTSWDRNSETRYTYYAWCDANGVFIGENAGDKFGWSVAGLGNFIGSSGTALNGDFCVGAPYKDVEGYDAGEAYIFLSDNAGSWSPTSPVSAGNADYLLTATRRNWEYFGYSVAGAGDVDADGLNEAIIGAPGTNRAYIFHGDWQNITVDFENHTLGTVTGTYTSVQQSDDARESIAEAKTLLTVWYDDFETDKGWTGYGGTGEWQRGTPVSKSAPSGGYGDSDPSYAHSGTKILGTDIGLTTADNGAANGDGWYSNNVNYANITSPPISTLGYTGTVLRFWKWLNVEGAGYDVAVAWVSNNGNTWTQVFTSNQTYYADNWGWTQLVFDISAVADNQATVYVRFGLASDGSNTYSGWNIDDVEILAGGRVSLYTYGSGGGTNKWINRSANTGISPPTTLVAPNEGAYTGYSYVATSDNVVGSLTITTGYYGLWRFDIQVSDTISDMAGIYFALEGTSGENTNKVTSLVVQVWNYTANRWDDLVPSLGWYFSADAPADGGTSTYTYGINTTILSGFPNYFNASGDIHFRCYAQGNAVGAGIWVDYVELKVLCKATYALEHAWRIPLPNVHLSMVYIEGYTSGEEMKMYYSFNGSGSVSSWNYLGSLTSTAETIMSFTLNRVVLDNIWLGIVDASKNTIDTTQDTVSIDCIWATGIPYSVLIGDTDTSFGYSVSPSRDMDGDGKADMVVGAPGGGGPPVFVGTNFTVDAEQAVNGTVTNNYTKLQASDDTYESIAEIKDCIRIWYDDFETDKGWTGYGTGATGDGEWQRGTPQGKGGASNGEPDPTTAVSGTRVLGNDLGYSPADNGVSNANGDYENSITTTAYIRSPPIDCRGYTGITLKFWRWLNVQGLTNDYAYVEVSNDGTTWTQLYPLASNPRVVDGKWSLEIYNISSIADNQATVYIRFGIKTDGSAVYSGWNIDDVELVAGSYVNKYEINGSTGGIYAWVGYGQVSGESFGTPPLGTPYTTYSYFSASDDSSIGVTGTSGYYLYWWFGLHINESVSDISALSFSVEGYGYIAAASGYATKLWIYNYGSGQWEFIDDNSVASGIYITDCDLHGCRTSSIANYVNSTNNVSLLISFRSNNKNDALRVDYVYLRVLSKATYFLEHKWRITIPYVKSGVLGIEGKTSGETMKLYYARSSAGSVSTWNYLSSLTSTTETVLQFNFGELSAGALWIGVVDANRGTSDTTADTLTLDAIWFYVGPGPPVELYRYVDTYSVKFGSVSNFENAQDDDADYATLAEQNTGLSSVPANHNFDRNADGWTSARAGTDDDAVTNGYDATYGNPAGSIFSQGQSKWTNADTNCIGIWEAAFDYYLGVPTSATLELNYCIALFSKVGSGTDYFNVSIITPSQTQYTIYTSPPFTGTTSWGSIGTISLSDLTIFAGEGTYKIRITTVFNIAASKTVTYTKIYYDKVYLNITTPSTYLMDVEFQFFPVRVSSDYYLELNYSASGEDFDMYLYNGTAWRKMVTLYKTPGTFSTYTYKLLPEEWNYGCVRICFKDAVKTGDTEQSFLNITYARIKYNPAGNVYLYYGGSLRTETRLVHDTKDEFTTGTTQNGVAVDANGNLTLEKVIGISDNFDAQTVGNNPDSWVVTDAPTNENILISDTTSYPSGGKCVELWDNLTTDKTGTWVGVDMYRNFTPLDHGVIELWINDASPAGGAFYIGVCSGGAESASGTAAIWINVSGGTIYWTSDFSSYSAIGTYTKNTWWKLTIIFDSEHDIYDVYYGNTLIGSNLVYINAVGALTTLEIATWDTGVAHAYVDAIFVYAYKSSGYLISQRFADVDYIYNVFSLWNYTTPAYTSLKVYVSRDDGNTWAQVANNSIYGFTQNEPDNKIFRYKIELSTTHAAYTPVLYNITFSFNRSRMGVIITGNISCEGFGFSVSGGGDYDGDGYRDLLIGAPYTDSNKGNIYAFYGRADWTFQTHLYAEFADITFSGENTGDKYGYCVYGGIAHITNLTGDAYWYNEIAVGAPLWDDHGTNCGRVYLYIAKGLPYVNITWIIYNQTTNTERPLGYWYLGKVGRTGWWNDTITLTNPQTIYINESINMTINVTSPTGHASLRVYFDSVERCSGYSFMPQGAGIAKVAWVKPLRNGAEMDSYLPVYTASDTLSIKVNITVVPGYSVDDISSCVIRILNASTGVEVLSNQTLINPETTGTSYKLFVLYNVPFSTWPAGIYKIEADALDRYGVSDYGYRFANNKVAYIYIQK